MPPLLLLLLDDPLDLDPEDLLLEELLDLLTEPELLDELEDLTEELLLLRLDLEGVL